MRIDDNGTIRDMTQEEIEEINKYNEELEKEYWARPYDVIINEKIRERYSESQEFAILRQKEEKPTEYQQYFNYCEECKAIVKTKKGVQ